MRYKILSDSAKAPAFMAIALQDEGYTARTDYQFNGEFYVLSTNAPDDVCQLIASQFCCELEPYND